MADDAVVFAMANPIPETDYASAKEAGAKVVGTGRSDAPNQINNVRSSRVSSARPGRPGPQPSTKT